MKMNFNKKNVLLPIVVFSSFFIFSTYAQPFTAQEKATFKNISVDANNTQKALQKRNECYITKDSELQTESLELQKKTGELHQRNTELRAEKERREYELDGFSQQYNQVRSRLEAVLSEMRYLEALARQRQAELEECRRIMTIFKFACNWAGEILGINKEIRNAESRINVMRLNENGLHEKIVIIRKYLQEVNDATEKNDKESRGNQHSTIKNENKISFLKNSLTSIRTTTQSYALLIFRLNDMLSEIESKDSQELSQREINEMRKSFTEVQNYVIEVNKFLTPDGLQLLDGERICTK